MIKLCLMNELTARDLFQVPNTETDLSSFQNKVHLLGPTQPNPDTTPCSSSKHPRKFPEQVPFISSASQPWLHTEITWGIL